MQVIENPVCSGYPGQPHPIKIMNKAGFTRYFKARTSRRVQVYRCPECGRKTVLTLKEEI